MTGNAQYPVDITAVLPLSTVNATGRYYANAGEVVLCDTTGGAFTVYLPLGGPSGAVCSVKLATGTNPVTIATRGTNVINAASTTMTTSLADEVLTFRYDGIGKWAIDGGQKSLPSLDGRYLQTIPETLIGSTGGSGLGLFPASRLTFPKIRDTPITTFQSGHGWTLSGVTGATFGDDTSDYTLGSQSLRLTTGGAGATHEVRSPVLTALDLSTKCITFAVKVDDFTHYSDLQLRVSSNGFTDFAFCKVVYTAASQRWVEAGQWQLITISAKAEAVTNVSWGNGQWQYSGVKGNVNWGAITGVRIKCVDDASSHPA